MKQTIQKIKLSAHGIKGMQVWMVKQEQKDGQLWLNEYPGVQYRYPVQGKFYETIQMLGLHVGRICDIKPVDEDNYCNITVTQVKKTENGFLLTAVVESTLVKTYTVNTPLVTEEDGYDYFDKVMKLVERIFAGVENYIKGEIKVDVERYLMDLHKDEDNFAVEVLKEMTDDEKEKLYIAELEARGHIVIVNEQPDETLKAVA